MNKEVSFPIAKLLKEKGFDEQWNIHMYTPTIAEVVMWLYEKHGIWVSVQPHGNEFRYFIHNVHFTNSLRYDDLGLSTPTEAYEAAIEYALKNLL